MENKRTVHFFATYYNQEKQAATLIQSLLSQTADNWKLTICSNGDRTLMMVDDIWGGDPRINCVIKDENSGFWGALNRKEFIENTLLDDELLINTSVEDYYVPKTVEYINTRSEDFIMWDFSHHHYDYSTFNAITHPRVNKIDWGNFAILGSVAKRVDISKVPQRNPQNLSEIIFINGWENFKADGLFVESAFHQIKPLSNIRLSKILFVKN